MAKLPFTRRDEYKRYKVKQSTHDPDGRTRIYKYGKPRSAGTSPRDLADGCSNGGTLTQFLPDSSVKTEYEQELTDKSSDTDSASSKIPKFGLWEISISVTSIIFFFFDLTTDIIIAEEYFRFKKWLAFSLTTLFIVAPSVVICVFGNYWYYLDKRNMGGAHHLADEDKETEKIKETNKVHESSSCMWCGRFLLTSLCMGPVLRYIEYINNGRKSQFKNFDLKKRKWYYKQMLLDDVDATMLRLFECFLEAAPQLLLQLYIIVTEKPEDFIVLEIVRYLGLLSSWISLAWSQVAFHKALRNSERGKGKMTIPGIILYFIWRLCEIGPRVVVLAMCAATFHWLIFVVVSIHWFGMTMWLFCQRTDFCDNKALEKLFNVICAYVMVTSFFNVREGHTRYRALLYYFITYFENGVIIAFWFYFTSDKSSWFYLPAFFVVIVGGILQISFQLLYYIACHPDGKILICLREEGDYTCYSSLCHSVEEDRSFAV